MKGLNYRMYALSLIFAALFVEYKLNDVTVLWLISIYRACMCS